MASQIQLRRDTDTNWASANPTLAPGEVGYDTTNNKIKMGNGVTAWNSLAYFTGPISAAVLNDLNDVTITSAADGDFLRWNGTAWINDAVNLSTDTVGSFVESLVAGTGIALTNNSGEAATPTVSLNATLDTLTDVVVTSPLQFQGLMYDGTNWVNSNIPNTYLVRNNTGSTLLKGTLVGAVGAEPSGRIDVAPFEVTGGQDSELRAMGIVVSNISNGANGEVISFGTLTGLDTRGSTESPLAVGDETWAAGDILFAHPTVNGKLTKVRPQHDLAVAFITVRHASTGQIAIRIIPGNNHLEWMHDVSLVDKTSGDFLKYNGTLWVNDQINLGTDTTGNYVNDVVAGTGISVTHTPGEGSSASIAINATVDNLSDVVIGTTYAIGDTGPAGGKIFITPSTVGNSTGKYFEAAPSASQVQRTSATGVNSGFLPENLVSGAAGLVVGTGEQNTIDIGNQSGNIAASCAAVYSSEYSVNGYSDWFLASKDELVAMYDNKVAIGGFESDYYWSSSEDDDNATFWSTRFSDGFTNRSNSKDNSQWVRPIRSFTASPTASSGEFLKYNGTAWVNDPINLGTDTIGNYVSDVTGGTGVTVTHTPGEGSSPTIAIGQSVATTDSPTFANLTITAVPTNVNHAATKAYVDYYAAGIVWHDAVRLATAAVLPGTPTYDNGTSGVGATLTATSNARLVIDGANATTNDRVLVKNQADATQNGVYKVTAQGSISAPYVLTRTTDFDASPAFENLGATGNAVYVAAGSSSSNQGFITLSTGTGTNGTYVIGTDDITFGQFTGTATFTAGAGLATTGNVVNVQTANASRIVVNSDDIDLATVTRTDTSGSAGKSFIQSFTTDSYGRVTGSVTADTAITLGTDTSGSYVESLTAGTGITLSNNSGEGATPTVAVTANTYDAYGAAATAQTNAESTASGYVSTHAGLTTVHGVTGVIVGTTDTQTLTNKTLTSPKVNENVELTATATELNILDGATLSTTELNYVDGVTSAIQTQLNDKAPLASPTFTGTVTIPAGASISGFAPLASPTFTGTVTVPTPIGNTDASTKAYVDSTASTTASNAATALTNHEADTTNIHGIADTSILVTTTGSQTLTNKTITAPLGLVKGDVGLGNVDNTADTAKPVSTTQQTALDLKANIASPTFTGTVTLAADPSSALHAATKQYVDNTAAGVVAKPSVLAATTTNIGATYSNGTLGVGATLTANSNGVFPSDFGGASGWAQFKGILVKNQTNKEENGRYFVSDMGSVSTPYVLTRCGYCDEASEIPGAYIFVQDGTLAGTGWIQVVADPATFVVGTDDIDVFQFSGAGTYLGGGGLVLTDNTFSVGTASTGRIVVNADNIDLASGITTTGTYKSVTVDTYGRVTAGTNPTTLSGYGITDAAPINNASFTGTFSAPSGTITSTMIADGTIVNGDINASAGIALSKLATSTAGNIIVYNSSGVPTAVTETGDVVISDTGVTSISTGVIVNADVSTTAAIDLGKLADISTNAQTASYTLVLADKNKLVEMSVGSGNTLTIPPNSSVAFPVGSQIRVLQTNTGQCTITPGAGVTINGTPGLKLRTQWASATLIKRATDTWVAVGDLSA
jgi:hypothetical protein